MICHPVDDYVTCLEHTFWHVAHRVSNAIDCDKVLPGNGIVEEFIANLSYPLASSDTVQNVAWYIITTGFKDFSEVIRQKSLACSSAIQMPFEKDVLIGDASILDDYLSKTESWRSALRLACAISKTDLIIISGDSNKINVQITQQQLCLGCL